MRIDELEPGQLGVVTDTGGRDEWEVGDVMYRLRNYACDGQPLQGIDLGSGLHIGRGGIPMVQVRPLDHRTDEVYLDENNRIQVRPRPPAPLTFGDLRVGDFAVVLTDPQRDGDKSLVGVVGRVREGRYTPVYFQPFHGENPKQDAWHDANDLDGATFRRVDPSELPGILAGGSPDAE